MNEHGSDKEKRQSVEATGALEIVPRTPDTPSGTAQQQKPKKPWYRRLKVWNLILAAAGVAVAAWLVNKTDQIAVNDQRAWVLMDEIESSTNSDNLWIIRVPARNFGKGPALDTALAIVPLDAEPERVPDIPKDAARMVLGPDQKTFGTVVRPPPPAGETPRLWIVGRVEYRDQFLYWRHTTFCAYVKTYPEKGQAIFARCKRLNHAD